MSRVRFLALTFDWSHDCKKHFVWLKVKAIDQIGSLVRIRQSYHEFLSYSAQQEKQMLPMSGKSQEMKPLVTYDTIVILSNPFVR